MSRYMEDASCLLRIIKWFCSCSFRAPAALPGLSSAAVPGEPAPNGRSGPWRPGGCCGDEPRASTGGLLFAVPLWDAAAVAALARSHPLPPSMWIRGSKGSRIIQIGIARSQRHTHTHININKYIYMYICWYLPKQYIYCRCVTSLFEFFLLLHPLIFLH